MPRSDKNSENCKIPKVEVNKLCVLNSEIKNANICNLNVDFINGESTKPVDNPVCTNNFNTSSSPFTQIQNGPTGPIKPTNPGTFDQEVWDSMWEEVLCQAYGIGGIQERLQCGRYQLDLINDFYGCKVCPPSFLEGCLTTCEPGNPILKGTFSGAGKILTVIETDGVLEEGFAVINSLDKTYLGLLGLQLSGPTGGTGVYQFAPVLPVPIGVVNMEALGEICACPGATGSCPGVPLNVWGLKAYPPTKKVPCNPGATGATGGTVTQILTNISFKLNVKNLTLNLATRSVYVMILFGYKDENDVVQKRIFYIGAQQFGATIDTLIGERFGQNIPLPTGFLRYMAQVMPNPDASSVVEMIVLAEDGLEIVEASKVNRDLPTCTSSSSVSRSLSKRIKLRQDIDFEGDAGEQAVVDNPAAPVDPFDLGVHGTSFNVQALGGGNPADVEARKQAAESSVQAYLLAEYWANRATGGQ